MATTIWKDRKRPVFGLPLSFTRYELTNTKFIINTGILSVKEEEIRLYRFVDVSLYQSFVNRLFNVGDIICHTNDKTIQNFTIKKIKNPREVKDLLSDFIENERDKKRVSVRELSHVCNDEDEDSDLSDEI